MRAAPTPVISLAFPTTILSLQSRCPFCCLNNHWYTHTVLISFATVTNYHKCSGLKQHKFILLQSRGQKCEISFTGLKPSCQQYWFLLEALREKSISLSFSASKWSLVFLGLWPLPPTLSCITPTSAPLITSPLTLTPQCASCKKSCDYIGSILIIQISSPFHDP